MRLCNSVNQLSTFSGNSKRVVDAGTGVNPVARARKNIGDASRQLVRKRKPVREAQKLEPVRGNNQLEDETS
jgi:hypothetical protein